MPRTALAMATVVLTASETGVTEWLTMLMRYFSVSTSRSDDTGV